MTPEAYPVFLHFQGSVFAGTARGNQRDIHAASVILVFINTVVEAAVSGTVSADTSSPGTRLSTAQIKSSEDPIVLHLLMPEYCYLNLQRNPD